MGDPKTTYDYLIIGGGMTAAAAAEGIRETDTAGSIGLISMEEFPPYDRPPLSKGLWKGKELESIWRDRIEGEIEMHLEKQVVRILPQDKEVLDAAGDHFGYGKLLIASGGRPRHFSFDDEGVVYFRTLADYLLLSELAKQEKRFGVVGGGFIGSEIAAALAAQGRKTTLIVSEVGIGAKLFPKGLSEFITEYYREKGVEVITGDKVVGLKQQGDASQLMLDSGKTVEVDQVVAGIGIQPNVELVEGTDIQVDDGILVGEDLQTKVADIYAAGDVARFPGAAGRVRVEHEDAANSMGRVAGCNMAGAPAPYEHMPMFYSDLFDLGYEAVGQLSAKFDMVEDWQETPYKKGVVYYLDGGALKGVLLWNVWDQVDAARALIRQPGAKRPEELIGKL